MTFTCILYQLNMGFQQVCYHNALTESVDWCLNCSKLMMKHVFYFEAGDRISRGLLRLAWPLVLGSLQGTQCLFTVRSLLCPRVVWSESRCRGFVGGHRCRANRGVRVRDNSRAESPAAGPWDWRSCCSDCCGSALLCCVQVRNNNAFTLLKCLHGNLCTHLSVLREMWLHDTSSFRSSVISESRSDVSGLFVCLLSSEIL